MIVYKPDGNSIRELMMELEPKREHVFFGKRHAGTCNQSDVEIVLRVEGSYFVETRCPEQSVPDELLDRMEDYARHFKERVLSNERLYPNLIILEIFKRYGTGEELECLLRRKVVILKEREETEKKKRLILQRREEEQKQRFEIDYAEAVNTFMAGGHIKPEWLLEMARRTGVRLHPRTLHNLCHYCWTVSTGSINIKDRKHSYKGVFNAIRKVRENV